MVAEPCQEGHFAVLLGDGFLVGWIRGGAFGQVEAGDGEGSIGQVDLDVASLVGEGQQLGGEAVGVACEHLCGGRSLAGSHDEVGSPGPDLGRGGTGEESDAVASGQRAGCPGDVTVAEGSFG